jgi:hypothetical protein
VSKLATAFKDGKNALNNWNDLSLDTWEAVANIQTALEEIFGFKVSGKYVKENLEELSRLASGSTQDLEKLRKAAAEDFILNLDIADSEKNALKKGLSQFLDSLTPEQKALGVSLNLEDS